MPLKALRLAGGILLLLSPLPALGAPSRHGVGEAIKQWNAGRQAEALGSARALAGKGDLRARALLGTFIHYGSGGSDGMALKEWVAAAEGGDAEGQYRVGWACLHGYGRESSGEEARGWFEKAAAQGHALAAYNLAQASEGAEKRRWLVISAGTGLPLAQGALLALDQPDDPGDELAWKRWWGRAAKAIGPMAYWRRELGRLRVVTAPVPSLRDTADAEARLRPLTAMDPLASARRLPLDFMAGMGLPEDMLKFERQGVLEAQLFLAVELENRGGRKALEEARRLLFKAAEGGLGNAQWYLATRYMQGTMVAADRSAAIRWAGAAAAGGVVNAWAVLGYLQILEKDPAAEGSLLKGVDAGDPAAMQMLGAALWAGQGLPRDEVRAERYLRQGAEAGHALCMQQLGELLLRRRNRPKDPVEAEAWLRRALASGRGDAGVELGRRLMRGEGLKEDLAEAAAVFEAAARLGDAAAPMFLALLAARGEGDSAEADMERWVGLAAARGDERAVALMNIVQERAHGSAQALARQRRLELRRMDEDRELEAEDLSGRLDAYEDVYYGTIDRRYPIVMGLTVAPDGSCTGAYFYRRKSGGLLRLAGNLSKDRFRAEERDGTGKVSGVFEGAVSSAMEISGTWNSPGGEPVPFKVSILGR